MIIDRSFEKVILMSWRRKFLFNGFPILFGVQYGSVQYLFLIFQDGLT